MERYNPPSTSRQAYCEGCNRQIRKVNEARRDAYMNYMHHQLEMNDALMRIRELERQVIVERAEKTRIVTLVSKVKNPEDPDEKLKELLAINKRLTKNLKDFQEVNVALPFEEWKLENDVSWQEKFEKLQNTATARLQTAEFYKEECETQLDANERLRKEVMRLRKVVMDKTDLIEKLQGEKDVKEEERFEEKQEKENVKDGDLEKDGESKTPSASAKKISTV